MEPQPKNEGKVQTSPTGNEEEHFPGVSVREAINRAVSERREEDKDGWFWYFNNFLTRLPGSTMRRDLEENTKLWQTPHGTYITEAEKHSPLYLQQSPQEFHATVDRIIAEQKIPTEEIQRLLEERRGYSHNNPNNPVKALYELTLPVYIALREMGYTRYELVS